MRWSIALVFILVVVSLFVVFECWAEDEEEDVGKNVVLEGEVSAAKDEDNNITVVFLSTWDDIYDVVLNAEGKKLGEELDGKKAEVTGTVEEKDDNLWLTVISYKEVKEDAEEEPEEEIDEGVEEE